MGHGGNSDTIAEQMTEIRELKAYVAKLEASNKALKKRVEDGTRTYLQVAGSGSIHDQVYAFHRKFDQPNREVPCIPTPDEVRLRVRIVFEEATEFVEACYPMLAAWASAARASLSAQMDAWPASPDIVKVADALGDIDYVVEGSRLYFGIKGAAVAAEIHRANMAKVGGGKDAGGKCLKPANWSPPDIAGVLRRQGWEG